MKPTRRNLFGWLLAVPAAATVDPKALLAAPAKEEWPIRQVTVPIPMGEGMLPGGIDRTPHEWWQYEIVAEKE